MPLPLALSRAFRKRIQGVTPDAQDLASSNTVQLLFRELAKTEIPAERDNLPDEVSGPAQPGLSLVVRGQTDESGPSEFLSSSIEFHDLVTIRVHIYRVEAHNVTDRQKADLIYSLCRLQC